jgi:hypothetical protein
LEATLAIEYSMRSGAPVTLPLSSRNYFSEGAGARS